MHRKIVYRVKLIASGDDDDGDHDDTLHRFLHNSSNRAQHKRYYRTHNTHFRSVCTILHSITWYLQPPNAAAVSLGIFQWSIALRHTPVDVLLLLLLILLLLGMVFIRCQQEMWPTVCTMQSTKTRYSPIMIIVHVRSCHDPFHPWLNLSNLWRA